MWERGNYMLFPGKSEGETEGNRDTEKDRGLFGTHEICPLSKGIYCHGIR